MKFLVGERRAVAAAVLAFYGILLTIQLVMRGVPPESVPMFTALAALYWTGFFGVVAGWFWGRWFASGLGMFGVVVGVLGMFQMGPEPILIFLAVSHGILPAFLAGEGMAVWFDGRTDWRARFHLDEPAVERLGKSITRAAMSLPYLILWALAPKQGQAELLTGALPLLLGAGGLWAVVRLRTWGVFALAGASATLAGAAVTEPGPTPVAAVATALLLAAAVAPFARPIARKLAAASR